MPETFRTQPTNQTAQFWSRASVQVSGTSFLSVCHSYYGLTTMAPVPLRNDIKKLTHCTAWFTLFSTHLSHAMIFCT